MRFSIITPTYRRVDKHIRAVKSLQDQTYIDWEIIIVNDSPTDSSYENFTSSINDSRIHYYVNDINRGVNYSRNRAIELVSADSKWIIFLDDDDYFAPDTLQTLHNLILTHQDIKWFVTNRAYTNGTPLTIFPKEDIAYSYAWEYLILKRCKGDATHCIETKLITHSKIKFSHHIKQAEEWFFFYHIGRHAPIFYSDHNSTITEGYDAQSGLNFRKRSFEEKYETLAKIFYEAIDKKIISAQFLLYMLLRSVKLLVGK